MDEEEAVFWCPFGVSGLAAETVLIDSARGPGWKSTLVYIISKACIVVPLYLSPRSEM